MVEVLLSPGMKIKTHTMSWNIGYGSTFGKKYKAMRENPSAVVFRPPKDGWYPFNIITEEIYDITQ